MSVIGWVVIGLLALVFIGVAALGIYAHWLERRR